MVLYQYETVNYIYRQKAVEKNVCIGKQKNQENTILWFSECIITVTLYCKVDYSGRL